MARRNSFGYQSKQAGNQPQNPGHPQDIHHVHLPTVEVNNTTYPCCDCPGPHEPNCMFNMYEKMTGNYKMTKDLMSQFINQMNRAPKEFEQDICGQFCQHKPLKKVDKPKQHAPCHSPDVLPNQFQNGCGKQNGFNGKNGEMMQECMKTLLGEGGVIGPQSQNRKLIEDQLRMKNLWVQFMNIFDMALDMAAEASNARWALNCHRKEDERLVCERRIEEVRRGCCRECCNKALTKQTYQDEKKEKGKKISKDYAYSNKSELDNQPKNNKTSVTKTELKSKPKPEPLTKPEDSQKSRKSASKQSQPTTPKASPKPSVFSDTKSKSKPVEENVTPGEPSEPVEEKATPGEPSEPVEENVTAGKRELEDPEEEKRADETPVEQ